MVADAVQYRQMIKLIQMPNERSTDMTRYFNYTFKYYFDEVTISKAVTDNMEERDMHKAGWAAEWMTQTLRNHTGDKNFKCVYGYRLTEVSKGETVSLKNTFKAMEKAHDNFMAELENGTLK